MKDIDSQLFTAAALGNLKAVKELHSKGANIEYRNLVGTSPLIAAAGLGHIEVVKYLVENGAYINHTNTNNHSALDVAAQERNHDIVNFLTQYNATPKRGSTIEKMIKESKKPYPQTIKAKPFFVQETKLKMFTPASSIKCNPPC